jgi:glycosyltransferase involved in cell wall biosynthesis
VKILILSPDQIHRYNWGHQLFRNEIGRQEQVIYWGEGFLNFNKQLTVLEVIEKYCPWKPDVILTYGWRYSIPFEGLGSIKDIAKVHITVDYVKTANIPAQNKFFKKNKYNLVFAITLNAWRLLKENNICDKIQILPFSVDINKYKFLNSIRKNQILAAFTSRSDIYPNRVKIQRAAKVLGYPVITKRIIHEKLIRTINTSKIILTSNNIFKSFSMRYTETMACGGFLLADKPDDMDFLGYINNVHFVLYDGIDDLKDKIKYYMLHDQEREKISKQGMNFVRESHSCKKRVYDMITVIKKELGG